MAYCTEAEVASEFKDVTFSTTTAVTTADVTRFIEEADAEINGRVGLIYQTPIVSTEGVKVTRLISIGIVSRRIKTILAVKTGSEKADQGSAENADTFRRMLTMIVKGEMILAGAVKLSTGDGVQSYNSSSAGIENTFKKGEDQW